MALLISEYLVSMHRVKKLSKWAHKNSNFGAYVEVEEIKCIKSGEYKFNIKLFQDKTRVDKYGNRYVI